MKFDDEAKHLILKLIDNYEYAWLENAALRAVAKTVKLADDSVGIPDLEKQVAALVNHPGSQIPLRSTFAQLRNQVSSGNRDIDLEQILRKLPPAGGVQ